MLVRDATASRMVVSSASDSSLPTSAPNLRAYLLGLPAPARAPSPAHPQSRTQRQAWRSPQQ